MMYGYEAVVFMIVGKAIGADRFATAQRQRVRTEAKRTRRFLQRGE